MFSVYGDPEVMRFVPGGALTGIEAVRSTLEKYAQDHRTRGFSSWAAVERQTGRPIGDVGFSIFEPTGDIELGYTLGRPWWGRGYGTEGAGACLGTGLVHLGAPRIIAVVDEANAASLRVAERIGMERKEGIEAYGRLHVLFEARP